MADAFAPKLSSDVRFNEPVQQTSVVETLAGIGETFLSTMGRSQAGSGGKPKVDSNLATFSEGLQRVQAIRDQKGEVAASVEERKLASNFAAAGINFDADYKAVYETTTGRTWAGYGLDYEAKVTQDTLAKPEVQAMYVASYAVNKDWTEEERIAYALDQQATMTFQTNEVVKAKSQANYTWTTKSEVAYTGTVDTFLNTNLGALVATNQNGGRVGPQALANLTAQWGQLKVGLTKPANVSDEQYKSVQDKITAVDNMIAGLTKASSSDVLFEEMTTALAANIAKDGSTDAVVAAMVAVKDPAVLANLGGLNIENVLMKAGRSLNLNIAAPNLFGHIVEDQGGVGAETDPNAFLSALPADIEAKIKDKTPEQIYAGLEASHTLSALVKPNNLQNPDGRNQFVENAVTIGAVLKGTTSDQFLSNDMLKKLVANPGFIANIKALETIDPESAQVTRTYVRTGLDTERAKQEANLGAIEGILESKGIVWDGNDYVMAPSAQKQVGVVPGLGGIGGFQTTPLSLNAESIRQAKDRRASLNTISGAMTALEVKKGGSSSSTSIGSTTATLLDKFEGGGGYDTLFGFANKAGGPFADVKVSEMTIGQLKDFSNGAYADYSRQQLGYKATPMGRFQFVGTTLASVANKMGLDDNTVFTPEVQNKMFMFHAKEVLAGKSAAGKRSALRQTWEGLKNASDAELNQMIAEVESGKATFETTGSGTGGAFAGATPASSNAVASASGAATQRAVENAPSAAPMVAPTVDAGAAPATPVEAIAAMPEQIAPTTTGDTTGSAPAPAANAEVQAAIQEMINKPDATYASDAEFLAAQEKGDLSPGDSVVVDGTLYIIRKDGTAKRIGNVAQ